jgi:peptidoglycan hydrolase CwlO-like protein
MNIPETSIYLEFFLTVAAVIAIILGVFRYGNKKLENKISQEIQEATAQIHPAANGGRSLGDLHDKVNHLQVSVDEVATDIKNVKGEQRRLREDIEEVENDVISNREFMATTADKITKKLFED